MSLIRGVCRQLGFWLGPYALCPNHLVLMLLLKSDGTDLIHIVICRLQIYIPEQEYYNVLTCSDLSWARKHCLNVWVVLCPLCRHQERCNWRWSFTLDNYDCKRDSKSPNDKKLFCKLVSVSVSLFIFNCLLPCWLSPGRSIGRCNQLIYLCTSVGSSIRSCQHPCC